MLAGFYSSTSSSAASSQPELAPPAPPEERDLPLREKLALLKELILPGLVALCVLGSLYLGSPRRPRRPASASSARCSRQHREPQAVAGPACAHADRGDHQGHGDAVLAVLRLVGADRRLHARRRHQADPGRDDHPAGRSRWTSSLFHDRSGSSSAASSTGSASCC